MLVAVHGSILSREEQEELLHHACRVVDLYVIEFLLQSGCRISILSNEEQEELLYLAMEKGHGERPCKCIAKKLILAGVNVTMQTVGGNTALHIAAFCNNIQCGILLAEGGASVRTKNNLAQTPLDLAKPEFKEATKKTLSFTTRKALCIIGNAEGGKKLTRCMEATRDLKELPLEFVGSNFLNCRQPQSTGIDHISKFIQEIPISEFRATHTRYSLAWVLYPRSAGHPWLKQCS